MTSRGEDPAPERWLTLPNVLCGLRLVLSPGLLVLAAQEQRGALLVLFVFLSLTDWLDGKLAVRLDQRSAIGPRLDTLADATLYACLGFSVLWLDHERLPSELPWIFTGLGAWGLSIAASLLKFRRWPSHHTRTAKVSWFLILLGACAYILELSPWPLRLAMVGIVLANLESLSITLRYDRYLTDVKSIFAAQAEVEHGSD